jgi:hypothetical protein
VETAREKKGFLSAHAAAERVDAMAVDVEPRYGALRDLRHPCQVADLSGVSPGEERQLPALALGVDDGEAAAGREVSPPIDVRQSADTTPVRRDDEWDRRMIQWAIPDWQDQVRPSGETVMGRVGDRQDAHSRNRRIRERGGGKQHPDRGQSDTDDRRTPELFHRTWNLGLCSTFSLQATDA